MYIVIETKGRGKVKSFYGPFATIEEAQRYQSDLDWLNEGTAIKTDVERLQKPTIFIRKSA